LVSPEEIQNLCPLLYVDDLIGGLWIPGDGVGDPYQICRTLIQEAQQKGIVHLKI
jgi:glycine/D-amino acid oxidase-like deaminating enzyme